MKLLLSFPSIDVNKIDASYFLLMTHIMKLDSIQVIMNQQFFVCSICFLYIFNGSPLSVACHYGHFDIVELLLSVPSIDINNGGVFLLVYYVF